MSFIFGGNTGISYGELQQRRKALNAKRGRFSAPKNVGEGLTALGIALADRIEGNKLNRIDTQNRENFNTAFDDWSGKLFGGSSETTPYGAIENGDVGATNQPMDLSGDKQAFIDALMPAAVEESQRTGVDPRVIVSQAALETGWGRSAPGNNFFGIKSHGKEGGQTFTTHEVVDGKRVKIRDSFRQYESPADSVRGYGDFILQNPRYGELRQAQGLGDQLAALQASGYATDPNYGMKVGQIARSIQLPTMSNAAPSSLVSNTASPDFGWSYRTGGALRDGGISGLKAPMQENLAGARGQLVPQRGRPVQVASLDPQAGLATEFAPQNNRQPQERPLQLVQAQTQPQPQSRRQNNPFGGVDPRLIQLMSNPYASPGQKALMRLMVQQQLKANAPVDPLKRLQFEREQLELERLRNPQADPLKQLQFERGQLELERLRNPQADPMKELQLQKMQLELQQLQNPERNVVQGADGFKYYQGTGERVLPNVQSQNENVKGVNVDGNLVNPITGEVIYQSGPSGPDFEIEQKLRKEFEGREGVGAFRKVRDAWRRVQASGDTPAGDVALIFNYMKMLDPGSVVREGEFATAQNSAGIPERARALYNQALTGQRLTPELRKDFTGQAMQLFETQAKTYNTVAGQYRGLAEQYGLEPSRIAELYEMAKAGDPQAQQAVKQMEQNAPNGANTAPTIDLPAPPEGIAPAEWPDVWKHLTPEERKHFQ